MNGEEVSFLLVIGIRPTACSCNFGPAYPGKRLGHLLASMQTPMQCAACTRSIGPRWNAAPAFGSVRIRNDRTSTFKSCGVCFGTQALQGIFVK